MATKSFLLAVVIVFGLLTIFLFVSCIILGSAGVIVTRIADPTQGMYLMMVATILGVFLPFTMAALFKYLVDYLLLAANEPSNVEAYNLIIQEENEYFALDLEQLQEPATSSPSSTQATTDIRRLVIYDPVITGSNAQELQVMTTQALMLTVAGGAMLMCSILSLMWSIFISNHFTDKPIACSLPYLLVQVLGGLISPIAGCVGVAMLSVVIRFITAGQLNLHVLVTYGNPAVAYTFGTDVTDTSDTAASPTHHYWVISDHYYLQITPRQSSEPTDNLASYVDYTLSTWLIVGTIVLSMLFTMNYFVNTVLVESTVIGTPPKEGECNGLNCYVNWNTQLVDCTDNTTYTGKSYLHCYSFSLHGHRESWGSISIAFGLYAASITGFKILFVLASMLLSLYHTRAWGVFFILVGAAGVIVTIAAYFSPHLGVLHLDEVKSGHVIIQFLHAVISGVLLLLGSTKEIIKETLKLKALLIEL